MYWTFFLKLFNVQQFINFTKKNEFTMEMDRDTDFAYLAHVSGFKSYNFVEDIRTIFLTKCTICNYIIINEKTYHYGEN